MQIPTSAGMLANSVLPVTPLQGALLSQVGETAGSTSFAPIEAVSKTRLSREVPEQRPQANFAPENSGLAHLVGSDGRPANTNTTKRGSGGNGEDDAVGLAESESGETSGNAQDDATQGEAEQIQRQQERQQQQDLDILRQLSQRDSEVRAHEQAHSSVGGQYAGSAQYTYQRGPDGVNYAVGGEVPIDVGAVRGDPQATLEKMQIVQRAALAPADPSVQDRRIAALASQLASQARAEIASDSREADTSDDKGTNLTNSEFAASMTKGQGSEQSKSESDNFQAFNDRIAKINEILLALGQSDANKARGQLLDDVV